MSPPHSPGSSNPKCQAEQKPRESDYTLKRKCDNSWRNNSALFPLYWVILSNSVKEMFFLQSSNESYYTQSKKTINVDKCRFEESICPEKSH